MKLTKTNGKFLLIVLLGLALFFFILYKFGFVRYYRLKSETGKLKMEIQEIEMHNDNLKAEIDSLKTMDSKIEKVAREKYNMIRKGEKVFQVVEK
ncbi:MAG: septum formation initiator family protein [Ignavibacteria bacterium]